MSLILVTAANRDYMDRIAPYLGSIQEHGWGFGRRALITVGCRVEMPPELENIEAVPLPADRARGHTGIWCVQQGCFLEVLNCADDDVIVFTDGDVRMQRPLSDDELAWMRALPTDTIALGWNAGPDDTLAHEAHRLALAQDGRDLFAPYLIRRIYNFGVIVTRAATYKRLYAHYLSLWPHYQPHTSHYAATQFLLCVCVYQLGLRIWELPVSVHAHGVFGGPAAGVEAQGEMLVVDGEPALFRHHWMC